MDGKPEKHLIYYNFEYFELNDPLFDTWFKKRKPRKLVENEENELQKRLLAMIKGQYYKEFIEYQETFKPFFFITINPDPKEIDELSFVKCYDIMNRFLKFKYIKRYEFIVEQRGQFERDGTHYHLLIEKTVKKSKILSDLRRVFKKYFCNFNIHVYPVNTKEILIDKRDYLRGFKDSSKDMKLLLDNELRKKECIFTSVVGNF